MLGDSKGGVHMGILSGGSYKPEAAVDLKP